MDRAARSCPETRAWLGKRGTLALEHVELSKTLGDLCPLAFLPHALFDLIEDAHSHSFLLCFRQGGNLGDGFLQELVHEHIVPCRFRACKRGPVSAALEWPHSAFP